MTNQTTANHVTHNAVLRRTANWRNLYFYQKADTLYQITHLFCQRFLPKYGDRTVDQMVQSARSGKQNIVEGTEDGLTSTEMEIRLLNVARSSIHELREDYKDYLHVHHLPVWDYRHPRYNRMLDYCRRCNQYHDYANLMPRLGDKEMANMALSLCHITDRMMTTYLQQLEQRFVTEGGIKERMHAARTGYRKQQDERMRQLEADNRTLTELLAERDREIARLSEQLARKQSKGGRI